MKIRICFLLCFFLLLHSSNQLDCNFFAKDKNELSNCNACISKTSKELVNVPILNGRPCWSPSSNCYFEPEPMTKIYTNSATYCGTEIETCNNLKVATKDYGTCIYTQVEAPYKCCYVGNGKNNRCLALDVHSKEIFEQTLYYIRMMNDDYSGNYEIECNSNYSKLSTIALILLGFFLY